MHTAVKVFVSYTQDSSAHADEVLALADTLSARGLKVFLDQYVPAPSEGWTRWMENRIDEADYTLMICTSTYKRRVMGNEQPAKGLGATWEGKIIYNKIYNNPSSGARFIPILLHGSGAEEIPTPAKDHSYYRIDSFDLTDPGFESLYRHLTGQPATPPPDVGPTTRLDPKPRKIQISDPRQPPRSTATPSRGG